MNNNINNNNNNDDDDDDINGDVHHHECCWCESETKLKKIQKQKARRKREIFI